jgi:transposase
MGKHFQLRIKEDSFNYQRKTLNIKREESLDDIYVIRTSVKSEALSSQVVASYKSLSGVERAFRSLKTVDQVRPIHHRLPDRVRAHILLCMLAYYVEWHIRQLLALLLFDDHDKRMPYAVSSSLLRNALVQPATRPSASARTMA